MVRRKMQNQRKLPSNESIETRLIDAKAANVHFCTHTHTQTSEHSVHCCRLNAIQFAKSITHAHHASQNIVKLNKTIASTFYGIIELYGKIIV